MESKRIEQLLKLIHLLPQEERILLAARLRQHEHTHSQHPATTPHPEGATVPEPGQTEPPERPTTLEIPAEQPHSAPKSPANAVDEDEDENEGLWDERDEPNSQSRKERILRQDKWLS